MVVIQNWFSFFRLYTGQMCPAFKSAEPFFQFLSSPEKWASGLVTDREVELYVVSDVIILHIWNNLLSLFLLSF